MSAFAFFHKQFVPLSEAKIGVVTQALHYGTAIFEGIRGNWNEEQQQLYIFRLKEHYQRMHNGCRILKIDLPYSVDELCQITTELVERCGFKEDTYIRPLAYKSSGAIGIQLHDTEDDFFIFAVPFGAYLKGDKVRCCVSSWRRSHEHLIPPEFKVGGLYVNNAMAKTEAVENGFDEAILLNAEGYVSEGSAMNLCLVMDGKLVTPSTYSAILKGITRDIVMELAKNELGVETIERLVERGELYTADECFLLGTAAHITPVVEIDHRKVGSGEVGEITKKLRELYQNVIRGNKPKYLDWCTPVYKTSPA